MAGLRARRERLGLSLREVGRATGVPAATLSALEEDEGAVLAPGSHVARARESYSRFLDERTPPEEPVEHTETTLAGTGLVHGPLPLRRAVAGGVVLVAIVFLVLRVVALMEAPSTPAAEVATPPTPPDQEVSVQALEPNRIVVVVDGEVRHDGVLAARSISTFQGRDRIEVQVPDLTRVKVRYNGSTVRPLGNLTAGRRLVFIDDEGS